MSGLVNVLYQSNLTYLGGELNGSTITIWLTGQFALGGVCDIPRAKAQLEYTAMAASDATSAQVFSTAGRSTRCSASNSDVSAGWQLVPGNDPFQRPIPADQLLLEPTDVPKVSFRSLS